MPEKKPHVVIVGAGFGGIKLAKTLGKENVEITLVDRHNFQLFQPLLYQVSTAVLSEDEIAYPVRAFFRNYSNVEFFMAKAEGVDQARRVLLTNHGEIPYDYLVLAAGSTTNFFGMESVERNSYGMKTLQEALHIRNHVLHMFERANKREDSEEERRRMLTFVVVGGGPTGIEEAGALAELVDIQRKEFHHLDFKEVSVKLIEATPHVLPMLTQDLQDEVVRVLRSKGVEVLLDTQVVDNDGNNLKLKSGEVIPTKTVIWAAGVKAVPFIADCGGDVDRGGRIITDENLRVKGSERVFAIGDCAHFQLEGMKRPLATIAPVATQGALVCARNIMHDVRGEALEKFEYHDLGTMATIGRGRAVVQNGSFKMKGFFAWVAWMFVHLLRLSGAHTNITVCLKWFWNLFSGLRLGRIITNIQLDDGKQR